MTKAERADVNARLDTLTAEILELAREIAALIPPPSPASVRTLARVAA